MAALTNASYGKGPAVKITEVADRITAALEAGLEALATLERGVAAGAAADQGAINTLRKVHGDLGAVALDARTAAAQDKATADADAANAGQDGRDGQPKDGQAGADQPVVQ